LKERYDHQKIVIFSKAQYDGYIYDCKISKSVISKSVSEYNSAMLYISSKLRLYRDNIIDGDMLEKTLSTFHTSNVLLQQQRRKWGFKKYCKLISYLLVIEQNNKFLMRNNE